MNTATHPVAPEDVMALLDGELASAEEEHVRGHLEHCAECAGIAREFRAVADSLSRWTVAEAPARLGDSVAGEAARQASSRTKHGAEFWLPGLNWKVWAVGGGAFAIVLLAVLPNLFVSRKLVLEEKEQSQYGNPSQSIDGQAAPSYQNAAPTQFLYDMSPGIASKAKVPAPSPAPAAIAEAQRSRGVGVVGGLLPGADGGMGMAAPAASQLAAGPMIARSVSLTVVVKDFPTARAALDSILTRHSGYSAQLTVSTPENAQRSLQASLRIPAPELNAALADLKSLGRVENESQSGEEVTQQHADLVARLDNSREAERRLRAILEQRTGKIEDVLQVEEEIARVRGEIEGMEAEQKALEHRVDFAAVELQLTEEFKAQLNAPSPTVSTRIHNAFVSGIGNAAETLLEFVLFFEDIGPVLLVWLAILAIPGLLLRRYLRLKRIA